MKNGRNTAGQFAPGNTGRPKGSRNKATIAIESLLQRAVRQTSPSISIHSKPMSTRSLKSATR